MPDPDGLGDEEEDQEWNLPSLDPTLDNQYYGFLNVPRFPPASHNWEAMMTDFGLTKRDLFTQPNAGLLNRQRSQQLTKGWQGSTTLTNTR